MTYGSVSKRISFTWSTPPLAQTREFHHLPFAKAPTYLGPKLFQCVDDLLNGDVGSWKAKIQHHEPPRKPPADRNKLTPHAEESYKVQTQRVPRERANRQSTGRCFQALLRTGVVPPKPTKLSSKPATHSLTLPWAQAPRQVSDNDVPLGGNPQGKEVNARTVQGSTLRPSRGF